MKYMTLLELADGQPMSALVPHIVQEDLAVWDAYRRGVLREMYFQPDPLAVSLVFEAASKDEVNAELARLPMVEHNLLQVRVFSLGPWIAFERLFDRSLIESARVTDQSARES